MKVVLACAPTVRCQHSFNNWRARWPESRVNYPHIVLENTTTDSIEALVTSKVRPKVQGLSSSISIPFGEVVKGDASVWLVPSESAVPSLEKWGNAQARFCLYSGANSQSVFESVTRDQILGSFIFEFDGVAVLLPSEPYDTVVAKCTGPWVLRASNYINGTWASSAQGQWMPIYDPATGSTLHYVAASTGEDAGRAVQAAKQAFTTWGFTDAATRAKYLNAIAAEIEKRKPYLVELETLDNGKSLEESGADIDDTIGCFRYYAERIVEFDKTSTKSVDVGNPSFGSKVSHEPMGVAALIVPWNYPLLMAAWKVAPCLAAGCTCILKPSELTPLSALELADIIDSVKLPRGVFNLLIGNGPDAGAPLSSHPDVAKVAFTGSVPTGSQIAATAGASIKRVSLELGGKSPAIVCADADIEQAIDWITVGIFFSIKDKFVVQLLGFLFTLLSPQN
jgi:hypothetical protein